jgi:hypothetical protein
MPLRPRGISRAANGIYKVRLAPEERAILASLPSQLRDAIAASDPSTDRLFPPAHEEDEIANADYRALVHEGLLQGKLAALEVFERTATSDRLDDDELAAWLGAFESLRLVLGTQLDVTEDTYASALDPDDPDTPRLALYAWLSWLQEEAVAALSESLPGG